MALYFSESVNNTGIVQQSRSMARVDSSQWPTSKIANSCNHWADFLTGYAISADSKLRWDNTNHTKLPEGTDDLVAGQSDYSYLTDEQGNYVLTLTGVSLIDVNGRETPLTPVDREDSTYDLATFGKNSGTPSQYDKITDGIVRLDTKPSATDVTNYDIKFYFQRTTKYFASTDTSVTTGFAPLLDRGFIVASAYDTALTLGLPNLQALSVERQKEEQKAIQYFSGRNEDEEAVIEGAKFDYE